MAEAFHTDVVEQHDDATALVLDSVLPFFFLPLWSAWRGHEHCLFLFPSRLKDALGFFDKPAALSIGLCRDVEEKKIFD